MDNFKLMTMIVEKFVGLNKVKTVIECGSHWGEDTLEMAKHFPNAMIYTFECNPKTLDIVRDNTKDNPRIVLTPKALSDKSGPITFYPINKEKTVTTHPDGNQGASSIFKASGLYPVEQYAQDETTVEAIRLDDFLNHVDSVDFMWLDAQGAELSILKGLGERIKDVKVIQTEVEFKYQYAGQPLFPELNEFLLANGFELFETLWENDWSGDKIYVNKKCLTTS